MQVVLDAEFDSLNPTRLWVVTAKDIERGHYYEFFGNDCGPDLQGFIDGCDLVVGHNVLGFDCPNLARLTGVQIPREKVVDTLVVSRLVWYEKPGGHYLENWAKDFGMTKVFVDIYDDPNQLPLYRERCRYDVDITEKVYRELEKFIYDPNWSSALRVEHELAHILQEMKENGFAFNVKEAEQLLDEITIEMQELEKEIISSVPPVVDSVKDYKIRKKKDGTFDKKSAALLTSGSGEFTGPDTYSVVTFRNFNPASPKDRIELLNASGWNPVNKTKGHIQAERRRDKEKLEHFRVYGWKVDEENLSTLPNHAPVGARRLAEWLTLEGRRGDLVEWINAYSPSTGRIHGTVHHIGSWTHRCSHSNPNVANIFSAFHMPKEASESDLTPVERIKFKYDARLRALFGAEEGKLLVGCDAEGIQLRVLAHLMGDEDYIKAVAEGRKEDETDVHNVNRRALGLSHITRDDSKTFIYAWLLGAGLGKVANILRCTVSHAAIAVASFVGSYPGLKKLKEQTIPSDAKRGFFVGLDGRLVACDSEHLMLAGYLQNGEKVIMAHALVDWYFKAKEQGLKFKLVDFVHDEWQVECEDKETAECLGQIMCTSLRSIGTRLSLLIPISGEYRIGRNWLETH